MPQSCQKHSQQRCWEGQNQRSVRRKSEGTRENTADNEREVQLVDLNVRVNERQVKPMRVITGGGDRTGEDRKCKKTKQNPHTHVAGHKNTHQNTNQHKPQWSVSPFSVQSRS